MCNIQFIVVVLITEMYVKFTRESIIFDLNLFIVTFTLSNNGSLVRIIILHNNMHMCIH